VKHYFAANTPRLPDSYSTINNNNDNGDKQQYRQQVLEKYELYEYVPIVDGIRKGDLRKFNDALLQFQHLFIR